MLLVGFDDAFCQIFEFAGRDAEHIGVAYAPAKQPAHEVALFGIAREYPITDHEDRAANVVGDHTKSDEMLLILFARERLNLRDDVFEEINREDVTVSIFCCSDALETATEVDVLLGQFFKTLLCFEILNKD